MKQGTAAVLNVGAGDTKLSFDKSNPVERIRAARIVKDMLRRGYALLVEVERDGQKVHQRAYDFDENTCEYIIADFDPEAVNAERREYESAAKGGPRSAEVALGVAARRDGQPNNEGNDGEEKIEARPLPAPPVKAKRGRPSKRIAAESTSAVAVARSAGG